MFFSLVFLLEIFLFIKLQMQKKISVLCRGTLGYVYWHYDWEVQYILNPEHICMLSLLNMHIHSQNINHAFRAYYSGL